jgi:hypothetical protein
MSAQRCTSFAGVQSHVFSCMYSLRLPVGSVAPLDGTLGRLEMRWRQVKPVHSCSLVHSLSSQSMGESGSLHTVVNMQQFKQPEPPVVELVVAPDNAADIFVEEPFDIILTVKNRGASPLVGATLLLSCNTEASIIPLGLTQVPIPVIAAGGSTLLTAQMLPIEQGLREIIGIFVLDSATQKSYQVCVYLFFEVQHL